MAADEPPHHDQSQAGPTTFETRDEDEVNAFISTHYIGSRSRFGAVHGQPRFRATTAATPHLQGGSIRSSIDYGGTSDPFNYQLFYVCTNGQVRVDGIGGREQRLGPGDASFYALGAPLDFDFHDIGFQLLALPPGRLEQIAEDLTGVPAAHVRFTSNEPLSSAAHRQWMDTFAYIRRRLDRAISAPTLAPSAASTSGSSSGSTVASTSPPATALLLDQLTRLLAAGALATFANTTLDRHLSPAPGGVTPAATRRAVAYLDSHAGEAVSLADVAAAAGTSGRALQYAFRRHHGTTPMGYLRRVRLQGAHEELRAADPGQTTVAAVAARWGFSSSGRFTAAYRQAFGELPRETLRS